MALHVRGDSFSPEQKRRDFDYYEGLTVRDSSLSACTQAVLAAEVGHLALAHAYAREAKLVDMRNLRDQIDDGLHLAPIAGTWLALVCGFGGLRDGDGEGVLRLAPRPPESLRRLAFRVSPLVDRRAGARCEGPRGAGAVAGGSPAAVGPWRAGRFSRCWCCRCTWRHRSGVRDQEG